MLELLSVVPDINDWVINEFQYDIQKKEDTKQALLKRFGQT